MGKQDHVSQDKGMCILQRQPKVVLDALNGVAFEDDKNVVSLNVKKEYTVGDEHLMVDVYGS